MTSNFASIQKALGRSRAVALNGPRQAGKSTLAQRFLDRQSPNYFDLENRSHLARLAQSHEILEKLDGLVVIDEVQLQPGLFPTLRVLLDRLSNHKETRVRYLSRKERVVPETWLNPMFLAKNPSLE